MWGDTVDVIIRAELLLIGSGAGGNMVPSFPVLHSFSWSPLQQCILDAGQSPTLARPAAPLATGVTKISTVDKTNKNWLPRQSPLSDR